MIENRKYSDLDDLLTDLRNEKKIEKTIIEDSENIVLDNLPKFQTLTPKHLSFKGIASTKNIYSEKTFEFSFSDFERNFSFYVHFFPAKQSCSSFCIGFMGTPGPEFNFGQTVLVSTNNGERFSLVTQRYPFSYFSISGDYFFPCFVEQFIEEKQVSLLFLDINRDNLVSLDLEIKSVDDESTQDQFSNKDNWFFPYYLNNDLKCLFLDLDSHQINELFQNYSSSYEESITNLNEIVANWKTKGELPKPEYFGRLMYLLPQFISKEDRIKLLKKIIRKELFAKPQREDSDLKTIQWDSALQTLMEVRTKIIEEYKKKHRDYQFSDFIKKCIRWLFEENEEIALKTTETYFREALNEKLNMFLDQVESMIQSCQRIVNTKDFYHEHIQFFIDDFIRIYVIDVFPCKKKFLKFF